MIVQIVKQIDIAIEMVENTSTCILSIPTRIHVTGNVPKPNRLLSSFNGAIIGLEKMFSNQVRRYKNVSFETHITDGRG
jgi:hypothetical protein